MKPSRQTRVQRGESTEQVITTIGFRGSAGNPKCSFAGQSVDVSTGNCEFVEYKATGAGCNFDTTTNGLYTTGNTILKGIRGGANQTILWDA